LVDDGMDGYVVPVADVSSLADRLYTLATNQEIVNRMSLKAKAKAQRFVIDNIARGILRSIDEVMGTAKINQDVGLTKKGAKA
jgi:glycosyltransferase involved in cell wall biosynthesis